MFYRYFFSVANLFSMIGLIFMPTSQQMDLAESDKEQQDIDSQAQFFSPLNRAWVSRLEIFEIRSVIY